jgi:preprotein translocase subunit SecG
MAILLYILFVVICLILILVVLVQDEQGDSLGGIFGGGSTTPFGSRSGNVLTRITGVLAAAFFLVSLIVGLVNRSSERGAITEQAAADTARSRFFEPIKRDSSTPNPSATPSATVAPEKPVATTAPKPNGR